MIYYEIANNSSHEDAGRAERAGIVNGGSVPGCHLHVTAHGSVDQWINPGTIG
ncbi:hypothetical protein [Methanocalculus sp. MC3]